ncbi:serine hydrolase [Streptomyces pathocidini]|uniref:Serine hydrolase n=1 Tax=Streptomyces pathocidini TaxID=1650571 RepID=A0ABW7UTJ7_9ACTN|nr:serine hydrolase domain-containing protein [Streptomyces pathocidini]
MKRRHFGAGVLALGGAILLADGAVPSAAHADDAGGTPGTGSTGASGHRTLRRGSPSSAGLLKSHLDRMVTDARAFLGPSPKYPYYPGAVLLAGRGSTVALEESIGYAVRYSAYDEASDSGVELSAAQRITMSPDTVFDLASVTKLFTSILAVQAIERGELALEAPVASYVPEFGAAGKQDITVRQLLTHTSGFRPELKFFDEPTWEDKLRLLWDEAPLHPPGSTYLYSDLNLIALQFVLERITGRKLDTLLHEDVTGPLGMTSTCYNPPASWTARVAATEDQRKPWARVDRGLVWGEVHDENAWSFGGVAGHAGVFSCAWDLAVLCRTLLNRGAYGTARILEPESVDLMFTDFNTDFPGDEHGLGFELYQHWFMGAMATPRTAGHTGFTGTSIVLDPTTDSFLVLLSNSVHPCRDWRTGSAPRVAAGNNMARAVPVRPSRGGEAWFAGMAADRTATLTLPAVPLSGLALDGLPSGGLPLGLPSGGLALDGLVSGGAEPRLRCALWWDTEPGADQLRLEANSGENEEGWEPVPFTTTAPGGSPVHHPDGTATGWSGRVWHELVADLDDWRGRHVRLRWRYATDTLYVGRGVYADRIRVEDGERTLFDDTRPADAARVDLSGWTRSKD